MGSQIGANKIAAKHHNLPLEDYLKKLKTENPCYKCKKWLPYSNFCKDAHRGNGLSRICKKCSFENRKHKDGTRGGPRRSKRGIPSGRKGKKFAGQALKNIQAGARRGAKKRIGKSRVYTPDGYARLVKASRMPKSNMRGENSPVWKGGSADKKKKDYCSPEYRQWRRAVFERDKYTCQDCKDDKGGNLEAHHLKPYATYIELRYEVSNGLTLCKRCHEKRHFNPHSTRNTLRKKKGKPLKF